jgi:glycosyltransferase involved in cell wall biosynthesis
MTSDRRVAWLSPFGPLSDIGAYTRCLLPHFAEPDEGVFDCDLYINANGPSYDSPVPTMELPVSGEVGEILSRYDAAFFNLGNNFGNHGLIVNALRGLPGIAVLHDFSYHHFFAHRCFAELRTPSAYARLMHQYYGSKGFNMALRSGVITRDATFYAPWDGENVSDYPLIQPIVTLASAAIVHSKFMEEKVAKVFKGPILRLYLPSNQKTSPTAADVSLWHSETATKERCQFASFGHIGRAKCLDTIILAMSHSSALRNRAHLVIAGKPDDKEYVREIESLVNRLGLTKHVTFEYAVTNDRLLEIKKETDVFVNLRYPNTEGASGSLVEMMNAGRPVIAYRAGAYADMPEHVVSFIERGDGPEALVEAMEGLMSRPDKRIEVGTAAANYLRDLDSKNYVRSIKKFVKEIQGDLRRRSRFVAPVREGLRWTLSDIGEAESEWFSELTTARRAFQILDRDRWSHSPEIFLSWPMDDLISFSARVFLHAPSSSGLSVLLTEYAQKLGRWAFYRLMSRLRMHQAACEKPELSKAELEILCERVSDVAFWDIAARLQPEIFVQILYLSVLERGSGVGERESWVTRLRQGLSPAAALLEFLASSEYRQAFSDNLMGSVEDWAKNEVAHSLSRRDQLRPRAVWPVDRSIRFNEDDAIAEALLGSNWHRRDAQGRWSNGRIGDLRFMLPEGCTGRGATLVLQLRVAGTKLTGERRITASHNQKEIASLVIKDDAPVTWKLSLPSSATTRESANIILTADQHFSPAAHGASGDRRLLGIMLIAGTLTITGIDSDKPSVS